MGTMLKLLKDIGLLPLIITAMMVLGLVINNLTSGLWIYLTYLFIIIRQSANLFAFMIDLSVLWTTTGIILSAWSAYWIFDGSMWLIKYFRK